MRYSIHCILDIENKIIALNPIASTAYLREAKTLALQYSDDEPPPPHPHAIIDNESQTIDFGTGFLRIPGFFKV